MILSAMSLDTEWVGIELKANLLQSAALQLERTNILCLVTSQP